MKNEHSYVRIPVLLYLIFCGLWSNHLTFRALTVQVHGSLILYNRKKNKSVIILQLKDKRELPRCDESESVSLPVVSDSLRPHVLQPARLLCPWDSPGKNTGVGCHALLQGIFPTQVSCIAGRLFTIWATQGARCYTHYNFKVYGSKHRKMFTRNQNTNKKLPNRQQQQY